MKYVNVLHVTYCKPSSTSHNLLRMSDLWNRIGNILCIYVRLHFCVMLCFTALSLQTASPYFHKPLYYRVFVFWENNDIKVLTHYNIETTYGVYGITFYVSYIHSRTMCVLSMEIAWKNDSNQTKYSKFDLWG